jgi:hypothetical protein
MVRRLAGGGRTAEEDRRRAEAAGRGLRYQVVTGGELPGQGPTAAAPVGAQLFSGASAGLAWSAVVEEDLDHPGPGHLRERRRRTRITFADLTSMPGTFLMVMALPAGVKLPPAAPSGSGGLLGRLAEKAGEAVLDLYVQGYFGAEHRALVNVAGAARPAGPPGLFILSTDAALAGRLLDAEGQSLLAGLCQGGGQAASDALDGFGLLVAPAGLVFGCQQALTDPAQLRGLAERVARLAARARLPAAH